MNRKFAWMQAIPLLLFAVLALCGAAHAQIVAFGASNISGWNVAASEATPAQLQSMLREKGYHVSVLNAGIYGNTTPEMRARMDKDIQEGTTIVILDMSGGPYNNTRKGISKEQGESDLAAIKTRLEERQIKVIPFSAADFPAQYHQQDGIHLTPEGHHLAATNLVPQITEILGPPAATQTVRAACAADAHRLCSETLGDASKRQQCMHDHRSELSKDCLHAIAESRQRQNND
jgi:lysophospholipase L1-like esterase